MILPLAIAQVATPVPSIPGFSVLASPSVMGLTTARGFVAFPSGQGGLTGFPPGYFVAEESLGRVSVMVPGSTLTPFATGLSSPTDLLPPATTGTWGNFLYVAEAGANRISRISNTGIVSTFANLPAAPRRMAFGNRRLTGSAYGISIYVTLANGQLVRVDSGGGVSTCVSGLMNPEGLVFGPGGSFLNSFLFVAETSANRISKVDPGCTTITPFALLNNPIALEVGPGSAWGPAAADRFTIYALTGSGISRVDEHGNVTGFMSGINQGYNIRFDPTSAGNSGSTLPIDLWGTQWRLRLSDAGAGTIEEIALNLPFAGLSSTGCTNCKAGDLFRLSLTVTNNTPGPIHAEIKAGFELPEGGKLTFAPALGDNKHYEADLPQGFTTTIPEWVSVQIPEIPKGRYCYRVSLTDADLDTSGVSSRFCFMVVP